MEGYNDRGWQALVESKTRTYHGRVGSGRPAERPGRVGQDWVPTELFAQETKVLVPTKASKKRRFNVSPEARTNEILCKPKEKQNQRLTRGWPAVYHRDRERSFSLAADQRTDAFLSL